MKEKLRIFIEDNTTKAGKIFDYCIQILILISLIAYAVETLPNNSAFTEQLLFFIEVVCVIIFSIEYVLRVYVAKKTWRYIFSFYGIIDLIAILPFYLNLSIDLRSLRSFRVFRIFRALKLIRYNKALRRFHLAAKIVKEEVILFFIVTGILIYLTASGIYFFEHDVQPEIFSSIFHSLWWAIVTLTTLGYGDVIPITVGGKIFTFFVLIIGIGIVTVPAGLVATALTKAREIEEEEDKK
ncbi:voltage-gated potassium channel [Kordia periserrulae]|uniref:Voltage-gated potassium channel n=1 Tax=Kordia periserrulae TaxID=701523 RepID=A0A2T6C1C8_9FLAO|nr:ion transporter [Kordia periserrulae]PTX62109.1 voltage-gated potassium channel [Kordia periserrulae]